MMASVLNSLNQSMIAHFLPFVMVALAIIFVMLAKMARFSITTTFFVSSVLVGIGWLFGFADSDSFGFHADKLGQLGLKILLPAVVTICFMITRKIATDSRKTEALLLVLISALGAMVTLVSHNWMLFFIGLQCLSLPLYGLLAFDPDDKFSLSSSMRYLLLSFVAMAILLFGILLLYAATGTMNLATQGAKIRELMPTQGGIIGLGLLFIIIGLSFKVSLFPFHAWAPEVYRGARLFVVSYLVVVVKSMVVLFLLRTTYLLMGADSPALNGIIAFMALFSMWVGNGMMLKETNLIRVLAFLSIGHLGALMIPILAHNNAAVEAIFLDIIAFGIAMLVVFASLRVLNHDNTRGIMLDDVKGLYHRHPVASIALAIALVSIAGFPLTAGFVGKLAIFQSGVSASLWHLVMHFILSSIIGLAVMAKIVASLWQSSSSSSTVAQASRSPLLFVAALAIFALGVFPEPWIAWIKNYTAGIL